MALRPARSVSPDGPLIPSTTLPDPPCRRSPAPVFGLQFLTEPVDSLWFLRAAGAFAMYSLSSRGQRSALALLVGAVFVLASHAGVVGAQTAAKPGAKPTTPAKPAVSPAKPPARAPAPTAKPTAKPAPAPSVAAAPAPPAAPVPPPAQDLRFKTTYTTAGLKTESVTYMKGERERFEFADMVVIKQRDLKRTLQISPVANTYVVVPDGGPETSLPNVTALANTPPKPAGVVMVTTTVVDTGERKQVFGREARHVRMTMDKQPMPGACDQTKQRMETDGWYIDLPALMTASSPQGVTPPMSGAECNDEIKATQNGDPKALGFPINYTMTMAGDDGKPNVVSMDITELETTTLDVTLFEAPAGFTTAGDIRALSKALSDVNEAKLLAAAPEPAVTARKPGAVRVGVPELTNSSGQEVDTRALRARLIADLAAANVEAEPLAAGSQADLLKLAAERGYNYLVVADVTELKVTKGGGLGGALRAASRVATAAAGTAGPPKDPTEATVEVKLVQPDGKSRLSTSKKGKDGGGIDMKTGIGLARMAGSMYIGMMTGRTMFSALNSMTSGNLSGMGMLGNPALMNLQTRGLGVGGLGGFGGMDPTAGAASFLIQQAMASDIPVAGAAGQIAPSFDAALGEALGDAAKAVAESLKKK